MTVDPVRRAYNEARDTLLQERNPQGFWEGELSSSALSTAVAVIALRLVDANQHKRVLDAGLNWLRLHQNPDGGWGDTTKSFSNISTSMLVRAAFADSPLPRNAEQYLNEHVGTTPEARAEAIRNRYGKDRTFSVPILMTSALAGLLPWKEVPRLPFELACLPQSWYRFVKLPVVSYALPALIAIGQCVHFHRPAWWNPLRQMARKKSLKVLERIQPPGGGFLEATPLTAFVVMALASIGQSQTNVVTQGVDFLLRSMRADGSWPIDTNLSIWLTTLAVNALAASGDLETLPHKEELRTWLTKQQTQTRHPFTGADPGAWGWSHCPGSVPDCDDTPGAILALQHWKVEAKVFANGRKWMTDLQNRDGGFPTFCRGWGTLPFDRSGADLTAHAVRAISTSNPKSVAAALKYLSKQQRPDGSWLPLWFGNQHAPLEENPVYGTARVLAAYRDLKLTTSDECQRGIRYLLAVQSKDGGWGGAIGCPSSVEETAVAVEVLVELAPGDAVNKGITWLVAAVAEGRFKEPSPIGFYFAKLWYFEKLYPVIFTVAALGKALRH